MKGRQYRDPVTGWWETVPVPRSVAVLVTIAYLLIGAGGVSVLMERPLFLAVGLGDGFLTAYWGGLLLFGGVAGFLSVIPGAYWLERIALAAIGLALVLYVVAIVDLQTRTPANVSYQAWLNAALLLHVAVRWERVRYGLRDPETIARRRRSTR